MGKDLAGSNFVVKVVAHRNPSEVPWTEASCRHVCRSAIDNRPARVGGVIDSDADREQGFDPKRCIAQCEQRIGDVGSNILGDESVEIVIVEPVCELIQLAQLIGSIRLAREEAPPRGVEVGGGYVAIHEKIRSDDRGVPTELHLNAIVMSEREEVDPAFGG